MLCVQLERFEDAGEVVSTFTARAGDESRPSFRLHVWASGSREFFREVSKAELGTLAKLRKKHGDLVSEKVLEKKNWWDWRTLRDEWMY